MKKLLQLLVLVFAVSCSSPQKQEVAQAEALPTAAPMGKYTAREPLPDGQVYIILEQKSSPVLEKNEIWVEVPDGTTEAQIATMAENFYLNTPQQRRYYMFFQTKNIPRDKGAYATAHFDPELKIEMYK